MLRMKLFYDLLATSKIAMLGAVMVTTAIGADLMLLIGEVLIFESHPYIGIVAYVVFPAMAAFGLILIPFGMVLALRRSHRDPVGKLIRHVRRKHVFQIIFTLTMINFVIFAFVGYRSIHFMESAEFCGVTCHTVMSPEYTVYQRSHHSGISCVECHVGPGVGWLIKSKLDGTRQLAGVLLDNYARPIQTPIHNMRPAEQICGECHSEESYLGQRVKVFNRYDSDEHNTKTVSIVNLRLGKKDDGSESIRGIHWHSNEGQELRYWSADSKREQVIRVELVEADGTTRVWNRLGFEGEVHGDQGDEHVRVMDCVDCHNRPTHEFLSPDRVIDELLEAGTIDPEIPWIRSLGYEVLTQNYKTDVEAMEGIARLAELYQTQHSEVWSFYREPIMNAIEALQELHAIYVYPEMKIEWNTYPSRIGHPTAYTNGCFRCHDGAMVNSIGEQITSDCRACHFVLAEDEQDPVILRMLEDQE